MIPSRTIDVPHVLPDRRQRRLDLKQDLGEMLMPLKHTTCYSVHRGQARFLWRLSQVSQSCILWFHPQRVTKPSVLLGCTSLSDSLQDMWHGKAMCASFQSGSTRSTSFQSVSSHALYADATSFVRRATNTVKPGQPELHTLVPPSKGHENQRTSRLHLTCRLSARHVVCPRALDDTACTSARLPQLLGVRIPFRQGSWGISSMAFALFSLSGKH